MEIYCRKNTVNGKVYIGKTVRSVSTRWIETLWAARNSYPCRLTSAITKYGKDAFKTEILYKAKTLVELNAMETFFIILYQSHLPENGYNMTLGGDFFGPAKVGWKHSEETKNKIRLALKGRSKPSPMKGRHHSDKSKFQMSLARRGKPSPRRGVTHTLEAKEKNRIAHLGKSPRVGFVIPLETRRKISATLLKRAQERRDFASVA